MPATASESLIALGCLGVATYWARQTAYANTGAGIQWNTLLVVACAVGLALVLSVLRADLGHALVAAALEPGPLKKFYQSIARSEERHFELFVDLARKYLAPDMIEQRWD